MYNEEIKERFLREINLDTSAEAYRKRMSRFEEVEEKLGKDLYEMTLSDSVEAFNSMEFLEAATLESLVYTAKKYVEWCQLNKIEGYNGGLLKLSVKDVDPSVSMSKMLFRDEQDLARSILKVREFNEGYPEVIAMVLAWAGLTLSQISELKDNGIDFESRTIKDEAGNVIADNLSDWVCDKLHDYTRVNFGTRTNGTTTFEVVKDKSYDYFVKRFCTTSAKNYGERLTYSQLSSAIFKMANQYENLGYPPRFTIINVKRSGALHRLWLLEQQGVNIDDRKNRDLVEQVYGEKKYLKIVWQYKYYKKAFNL